MEFVNGKDLVASNGMEAKDYWVHVDAEGPLEKYPAKQHARRVQEKLGIDEGLIYLAGQPAKNNEDSDMPAPFRQRRYFYYLTGCNEPSCHMTYDIQHDTLSLFIPRIDPKRVIWNGRGSTLVEALERYDVDEVYYIDELSRVITDWNSYYGGHGSDVYVLHDGQLPRIPGLHAIVDSESLQPAMNAARMIKDEHEIKLIRKANDISSEAHEKVLANILKFKNEAQVEGLFLDVCISHQAKQQAYDPIAASGPNAGTLHYDANNENFEDRQLMCLDAGCEFGLYASDITRTFPLTESWPSEEAENIYKLVERMQESCIARLAPGVRYLDLHVLAHQIAIDGLLKLGIFHNGTREEIYTAGTSRAFFPHGLGHHVGLEVHDVGQAELMSVRRGKAVATQAPSLFPHNHHIPVFDPLLCHAPTDAQSSQLEEGMVITVEPGIYFSIYALQHFYLPSPVHSRFINQKVLKRYMPVGGVRIEDDILITSRGYENLTRAPKGDNMFDIIRGLKSKFKQPAVISASRSAEPLLFRAPGCPVQTKLSGMQSLQRTATMPNQIELCERSELSGRDHALSLRRSMTTNERIQYWRQSCQQDMSHTSPVDLKAPTTVCGSLFEDVKHTFIGDDRGHLSSKRKLPACSDCTILVQSLERLRQNLNISRQRSAILTAEAENTVTEPTKELPSSHPMIPVSQQPARGSYRQSSRLHESPSEQIRTKEISTCIRPPQPILPLPPYDNTLYKTSINTTQDSLDHPEPEQYYRDQESYTPPHIDTRIKAQQTLSYTTAVHSLDIARYPVTRLQASMPVRPRDLKQQEQRRPSNHTDDRDWMA